jgi:predicted nucleotidyltransferase
MNYGLTQQDVAQINQVFELFPSIDEVIIFGSRAMGNFKMGSDIDFAVKGDGLTFDDLLQLSIKLDSLGFLYRFDVQLFEAIKNPDLLSHINRVGKVFYTVATEQ